MSFCYFVLVAQTQRAGSRLGGPWEYCLPSSDRKSRLWVLVISHCCSEASQCRLHNRPDAQSSQSGRAKLTYSSTVLLTAGVSRLCLCVYNKPWKKKSLTVGPTSHSHPLLVYFCTTMKQKKKHKPLELDCVKTVIVAKGTTRGLGGETSQKTPRRVKCRDFPKASRAKCVAHIVF